MRHAILFAFVFLAIGCKSKSQKERESWDAEFGKVESQYAEVMLGGGPQMSLQSVRGRPVLITGTGPRFDRMKPFEARSADAVGIVVVVRVQSDPTPSAEYEGGIKGYGGTVELAAYAHPEAKRLAFLKTRCEAPPFSVQKQERRTVSIPGAGEHCTANEDDVIQFATLVAEGRAPVGSDAFAPVEKAFRALFDRYHDLPDEPAADAPSIKSRKLLFYSDQDVEPTLDLDESLLPATAYAYVPEEVGAFGVLRLPRAPGGQAELLLVAHPEGKVVARTSINCPELDAMYKQVLQQLGGKQAEAMMKHCLPDTKRLKQVLSEQLGVSLPPKE